MAGNQKNIDRETWQNLSFSGKLRYLWDYYKLPFAAGIILLYIIGYSIYGKITRKDPILHAALVNVAVSPQLEEKLSDQYMRDRLIDPDKNPLRLYKNLYLTDNPSSEVFEYTQASQIKILSAIEARELDVVFLDQEAFDAFAQNGFLQDLEQLLQEYQDTHPSLSEKLDGQLVMNMEILEDNAKEIALDPTAEYHSVTDEYRMAVDLSASPLFLDSGFTQSVFLGVIRNSPRKDYVMDYLEYLYQ